MTVPMARGAMLGGVLAALVLSSAWQLPFPAVDTHVHLANVSRFRYNWSTQVPQLYRDWTTDDYLAASNQSTVVADKIVFIEVDTTNETYWLDEVRWVQSLADRGGVPEIAAIVGHASLEKANVGSVLDQMQAMSPLLRGIREGESAGWLNQSDFARGVRELAARNLSFDVLVNWDEVRARS